MSNWQNKIVAWENVAPEQLLANPANFRRHPAKQREALRGSLNELDIIAPVIVNRTTGHLLDGHARVEEYLTAGVKECPVAFVEIPAEKEALALLSLDPIAAMAEADKEALDALLRDVATGEEGLQKMLAELAEVEGIVPPDWSDSIGGLPAGDRAPIQQMTFTLTDEQAATVRQAIKAAGRGEAEDTGNTNGNGNALAVICEVYLGG